MGLSDWFAPWFFRWNWWDLKKLLPAPPIVTWKVFDHKRLQPGSGLEWNCGRSPPRRVRPEGGARDTWRDTWRDTGGVTRGVTRGTAPGWEHAPCVLRAARLHGVSTPVCLEAAGGRRAPSRLLRCQTQLCKRAFSQRALMKNNRKRCWCSGKWQFCTGCFGSCALL